MEPETFQEGQEGQVEERSARATASEPPPERRRSRRSRRSTLSTGSTEGEGPDTSSLSAFLLSLLSYDAVSRPRDDDDRPTITSSSSYSSSFSECDSEEEVESRAAPEPVEERAGRDELHGGPKLEERREEQVTDHYGSEVQRILERVEGTSGTAGLQAEHNEPLEAASPSRHDYEEATSGGEEYSIVGSPQSDRTTTEVTTSVESDWQLVSESPQARARPSFWKPPETFPGRVKTIAQLVDPKAIEESRSPRTSITGSPRGLKLPELSEPSLMLTEKTRALICSALPALVLGRPWALLYSTEKHGISLHTLYRNSAQLQGPTLLVLSDHQGAIFGGFTSAPLTPSNRRKYVGSNDCFVFMDHGEDPKLYKSTGSNRYFVLPLNDALSFGGGGHFAIRVDTELLQGSSGPCDTFGSVCLAKSEEFEIRYVELWGFSRAGRRLSRSDTVGISNTKPDALVGNT